MKKGKIKIAAAPVQGEVGNPEENKNRIKEYSRMAKEQGADMVCFPELLLIGGDTEKLGMQIFEQAERENGLFHNWLSRFAKDTGIYIAVGVAQQSMVPGRLYSSYIVCSPEGGTKTIYQKRYFDGMDQLYLTGSTDKHAVVDSYSFGRIAYALGADIETDEYIEELSGKSPDLILAAATGEKKRAAEKLAEKSGAYVVYVTTGYSCICGLDGALQKQQEGNDIFLTEIVLG